MRQFAPRAAGLTLLAGLLMFSWTSSGQPDCPAARLRAGGVGQVTPGEPNRVRAEPSSDAEQVGAISGGATFDVLDGPVCADGYRWWLVQYADVTGWTAEGEADSYFVEPVEFTEPLNPTGLIWTPDGTRLIVGTEQGNLIFDAADWEVAPGWIGRGALKLAIRESEPATLIVAPADPYEGYILSFYDLVTGDLIDRLAYGGEITQPPVTALAAAGDRFIYIIDNYAYETQDGVRINAISMPGGADAINVAIAPNGQYAAVLYGEADFGSLQVGIRNLDDTRIELAPGSLVRTLETTAPPISMAFSPDGGTLVVGDDSGFASIWSVTTTRQQQVGAVLGGPVTGVAYSADGAQLAVFHRQRVLILDTATLTLLGQSEPAVQTDVFMSETFRDVAYSPDGRWLAILDGSELIVIEVDGYDEAYRLALNDL